MFTLTETTAPLTRSTMSAKEAGPLATRPCDTGPCDTWPSACAAVAESTAILAPAPISANAPTAPIRARLACKRRGAAWKGETGVARSQRSFLTNNDIEYSPNRFGEANPPCLSTMERAGLRQCFCRMKNL